VDKKDIKAICRDMGAYNVSEARVSELEFSQEIRNLCKANACGRYGSNYTCPPFVGELSELIEKVKKFQDIVVWQNVYPLEDSFDIEGMLSSQEHHNAMTLKIAKDVYAKKGRNKALILSAGGCTLCKTCNMETGELCCYPGDALVSLEAYGINVASLAKTAGMKYIAGENTVTYFSGAFI
jgi:predicted metal-binding protein